MLRSSQLQSNKHRSSYSIAAKSPLNQGNNNGVCSLPLEKDTNSAKKSNKRSNGHSRVHSSFTDKSDDHILRSNTHKQFSNSKDQLHHGSVASTLIDPSQKSIPHPSFSATTRAGTKPQTAASTKQISMSKDQHQLASQLQGTLNKSPAFVNGGGYVRRLAAKNAMACVNAMFATTSPVKRKRHQEKSCTDADQHRSNDLAPTLHNTSPPNATCLGKRKDCESNGTTDHVLTKRRKIVDKPQPVAEEPATLPVPKSTTSDVDYLSSPSSISSSDSTSSSSSDSESDTTANNVVERHDHPLQEEYCDNAPYSLVGILYNGDCVHSSARFYHRSQSSVINRIVPVVVPSSKEDLCNVKESVPNIKQRSQKGDNGWIPIGNPIKTILIKLGKGKKVQRKYFMGIKRKEEEVFSRDSILLRSGSKKGDVPFVAKISSIWQESGGLMVTVFWYYRMEDTDAATSAQFVEMEVMASQHYDDISVACIDDKCHVLGLTEFCRFKARMELFPLLKSARLSENYMSKLLKIKSAALDDRFEELLQSDVYVCFRAYNHIAGKILKVNSLTN